MVLYLYVYVCTCLWPSEAEVSARLLPLIRLQKWVCSLSPLSPACLPLPLSNSFCLSLTFSPSVSLPLSSFLVTEACGLRHPGLFLWQHYRPPLSRALLSIILLFPLFLPPISCQLLTGSSPAAGQHSLQEAGSHVTLPPDLLFC